MESERVYKILLGERELSEMLAALQMYSLWNTRNEAPDIDDIKQLYPYAEHAIQAIRNGIRNP